jgi:exopolysaccharide biosynthesis protein
LLRKGEIFLNKKLISFILTGFLVFSSSINIFGNSIINQKESEINLSKGVKYKNIYTFTEDGIQNVNLVVIDLNDPNVKLDILFNKDGFTKRQKVSDMVKNEDNVLAAINGDFFSMSNPSFSLGPIVKDGKVLSNPHYEVNKYASFLKDIDNNIFLTYLKPDVSISNTTTNNTINIAAINKPSQYFANIVVYTNEYIKNSPGANDTYYDLCEVVVEDNVVKEVRYGQPSIPIPENGYIIVAGGNNGLVLRDNFNVGDEIKINSTFNLDYNNIDLALGGGSLILKDGEIYPPTQKVKGKSQRSAVGITPDNKLILFTVDGRLSNVIGMDENDVAHYMKSLGCKDAMLFDGGGSTELIVKNDIVNTLVGGKERPIVNSLAIKNIGEKGDFSNIEAYLDKNFGYVGDEFKINIGTFDSDYNPINIPIDDINFDISGIEGSFDKNVFIPTSGGKGTITVSYEGEKVSIPIDIVEKQNTDSNLVENLPEDGFNIAFLGDMSIKNNRLLDKLIHVKYKKELEKNSDTVVFIGNLNSNFESNLNKTKSSFKKSYSSNIVDNNLIISLDSSNGGFYKIKGQWDFLKNSLDTSLDNIFIVLNSKDSLKLKDEIETFKKTLYEKGFEKNIYVIYKGNEFSQIVEGNVRYISIPDYKNVYKDDFLNDYKYLLINIKDDEIKYTYKNILDK